jgi:hypothetical protein
MSSSLTHGCSGAFLLPWLTSVGLGAVLGVFGWLRVTTAIDRGIALAGLLVCAASALVPPPFVQVTGGRVEWDAVGEIRTVISVEIAYQSVAGHYGTITCLATPAGCIANYPANAPTFLDASLAQPSVTKEGYRRQWFEKPSRSASTPGAIDEFCYAATPVPDGPGIRSFGGDSSGRIGATTAPLGIEILLQGWRRTTSSIVCCNQGRLDTVACPQLP